MNEIIASFEQQETIKIVFMCVLNCSRSPYAEIYFEKLVTEQLECPEKIQISSRGVIPYEDIHELTRKALLEKGVPVERVSRFKPTTIKRKKDEALEPADLILVTSKRMIELLVPKPYREKSFMMSEPAGKGLIDIPDFAQVTDYKVYKERLAILDEYLAGLLELVKRNGVC